MTAISLHAAVVPPMQQILTSVGKLVEKAEVHCREQGVDPREFIAARIHPDMLPFAYQVKSTAVHSIGAIEGVRAGRFSPDLSDPGDSFGALLARVEQAQQTLATLDSDEFDECVGKPMRFEIGRHYAEFTAEAFLLHFSLPNFYFHAATAYDILRAAGLDIGKVDFLGRLSFKRID